MYLLEGRDHDIGAVVDGQNNIGDTSSSQAFNLVKDHRAVSKFHQGFGKGQSLVIERPLC
jgi:hypothetical protein